jgi:aquaporin Z
VNPARSTGPAIIQHGWALEQLWVFFVAPIVGAIIAGASFRYVVGERMEPLAEPLASTA